MSAEQKRTRRDLLRAGAAGAAAWLGAAGCKEAPFTCAEAPAISEADRSTRVALAYVDTAADPARPCDGCTQWVPASARGTCGGCKIMKGPIHPKGTCKAFAARG